MTMTMWLLVWAVLLTTSSTALEVPESFEASPWTLRPHRVLTDKVRRLDDGVSEHFELHRMSSTRESWVRGEKASLTTHHEVMIAVKQANLDKLDVMLQERSTPGTPLYRQWMSFEEIGAVTANPTALAAIKTWLQESNIHISWVSPREEYILASAPISTWNKVLKTEFFEYHDTHEYSSLVLQRQGLKGRQGAASASSSFSATEDKVTLLRAEQCFVPSHLSDHIVGIFHTTQVSIQP
jgi:Pro-kumamolisin, activation domain